MIEPEFSKVRIFVRPGPTDMRKQINGLALIAEQDMGVNPFEPAVFVFCNAARRILKALYWQRNGFCLWMKRLEKHRFAWPQDRKQAQRQIDEQQLGQLLSGIDFWGAHEELFFKNVG
jgi:transposase